MPSRRHASANGYPAYAVAAYVRGGRFAAVSAVLGVLHVRGLVEVRRPGSVALTNMPAPRMTKLEWAIKHAIGGGVPPRALMTRPTVEAALDGLRDECLRQGLVRPWLPVRRFVPARSRKGRRLLADQRRVFVLPPETPDTTPSAEQLGMLTAVYGTEALRTLIPTFAARSGLLGHRSAEDVARQLDPDAYNTVAGYYGL